MGPSATLSFWSPGKWGKAASWESRTEATRAKCSFPTGTVEFWCSWSLRDTQHISRRGDAARPQKCGWHLCRPLPAYPLESLLTAYFCGYSVWRLPQTWEKGKWKQFKPHTKRKIQRSEHRWNIYTLFHSLVIRNRMRYSSPVFKGAL